MRLARRIAIGVSILALVASILGFVVTLVLNAFVLDEFDAYGEVPIPGSGRLHLPAGEVTVSFHTAVTGSSGGGLPVPDLQMSIHPPEGVADPKVTESFGGTTTVNNDARVRVWVAEIPREGTYEIVADGQVNGYISPRLAFGHDSSRGWVLWLFGGMFVVGLVALFGTLMWSARAGKKARPLAPEELLSADQPPWTGGLSAVPTSTPTSPPADSYTPSDQGVRLEQLKQLAALRDSGALTEAEFDAEKRRILEG